MKRTYASGFIALFYLTVGGLGSGCVVSESTDIKTSGIWARFTVDHDAHDTVTVRGELRVSSSLGNIVDLTAGEHLEVNGTNMTEWVEPVTGYHWSRAVVTPDPDGIYDVDFVRLDEIVPSSMVVPDRPFITGLTPGDVIYSEEVLTINWDATAPGDDVDIFIEGDCIENHAYYSESDSGMFISDELFDDVEPAELPMDCVLQVTIARNAVGSVSSAFRGGFTEATIVDEVLIDFETLL